MDAEIQAGSARDDQLQSGWRGSHDAGSIHRGVDHQSYRRISCRMVPLPEYRRGFLLSLTSYLLRNARHFCVIQLALAGVELALFPAGLYDGNGRGHGDRMAACGTRDRGDRKNPEDGDIVTGPPEEPGIIVASVASVQLRS